tara:strand:- start:642 stop:1322 length:681 start_codon:yes stop_codon:yes gene_type:complete
MKKKRSNKNYYFTKDHENAIVTYASTNDKKIRTELYIKYIGPVFSEMVDKIIYTYKFTNLPNIDPLKEECKIWLTTILDKFDPEKGSKAFSYFSVITKNWFIHKVKKNTLKYKREIQFEDIQKELECTHMSTHNEYYELRAKREFWEYFLREIDKWRAEDLKVNERKVIEAVKILFDSSENIEIFNKKAVYLYLREITGLNTKQVVNNLNKFRERYRRFIKKWNNN